jgi:outer membrane protein insertion porin family
MSPSRVAIAGTAAMLLLSLAAPAVRAQPADSTPTAAPAPAAAPVPPPPPPPPAAAPTPPSPTPTTPPPATSAATAATPTPAPPPTGTAVPASGAIIAGYGVTGQLIDPADRIQALLESVAPIGTPFIESGPADRIGTPIGTLPRLTQALDSIGYSAQLRTIPGGGRVQITVQVHPYDRLRYVFVTGNWPIRQDEIQRRIALRPGSPLPPPGPERDATVERERGRVVEFLRGEGYFESNVRIDLRVGAGAPAPVDLTIDVRRGPAFPLGPIKVTGNTAIPTEEITDMLRHSVWYTAWTRPAPFTAKQLREDLAKLTKRYRQLGYIGARVTTDFNVARSVDRNAKNVALGITISERKKIAVAFEGNQRKSSSTLKDELTIFDRGSYDDYEAAASTDALQRYYQQQGFFFARVEWRREALSATDERIVFIINEGPELKVRSVEFAGNQSIRSEELANVVTVRRYPTLGAIGLGAGGYVTGRQMEQDAERLIDHYHARGFPEAKAHADAATAPDLLGMVGATAAAAETVSRDAKAIFVRFTIAEGPRVVIDQVDFKLVGQSATAIAPTLPYDRQFLLESLTIEPGHPYNAADIREDGRRLERLFGDAGYPSVSVEPEAPRHGNRVALTWVIKPGPLTRLGPFFVRGNFVTTRETVLEQIPLESGGLLTTTNLERGQRNLGFLQLFNNAQPISFPGKDERRDVVPMVVQVEERYDQYSVIHVGVGGSTDQKPPDSSLPFGYYVRAGYENRDLIGHGWNVNGNVVYGTSLLRGNLSFLDRRFFGTLFRFDTSLSYLQQATVRLGDIHSGGGSIGFSREMYPGVDAGIHYNLRNTTHTESLLRSQGPDALLSTIQLGTTVGSLSFNIEWLRLDNRLVPTRGFRLDAVAEVALPVLSVPLRPLPFSVGDDTFVKVGVHSMTVIPLTRWLSLRHGLRFDTGIPLGGASLLPKVERFFAGGDTTIRGFKLDRARIEEVRFQVYPGVDGVEYRPLGGNLRILQNIDLQFPISPPFYGAVFMDNGVVADSLEGLSARQFRHGVGVSPLLVKLPVGDLSFSWAWPLDPGPGDTKIGVLHVNIGLLF